MYRVTDLRDGYHVDGVASVREGVDRLFGPDLSIDLRSGEVFFWQYHNGKGTMNVVACVEWEEQHKQ